MGLLDFRSLEETSFTGTIGVDYLYADGTGDLLTGDVTGEPLVADGAETGRMVFTASVAATGAETFTSTGAVAFGFSEALAGTEQHTGTAAVAFGFSEALAGSEAFAGTAAAAFTFAEALVATERFTGTGSAAFGFSESGSGAVGSSDVTGTGAIAFGFTESATGQNDSIVLGHGGRGIITHSQALIRKPIVLPSYGEGGVAFGFAIAARGDTNDDDLALLLAA